MSTLEIAMSRDAIDALNRTHAEDQARIAELEARLTAAYDTLDYFGHAPPYDGSQAKAHEVTIAQLRSEVERYKTALLELLPGLSIDLRYAHLDDDADVDALRSRVETIHRALKEPPRG